MENTSETGWEALELMTGQEIDYSDIPPLLDSFFESPGVWHPKSKVLVTVEMEADLLDGFQKE